MIKHFSRYCSWIIPGVTPTALKTFYSDRNAAAFEIHDNSSVELVNSEVRMVSGRWFDIRANSAINLNSTLLSGESTLAMIDSESYLNAYNSTIVSVDPYYLYADYPLIEYDHTLSFINIDKTAIQFYIQKLSKIPKCP